MDQVDLLRERLARVKAALREAKRKEKGREEKRIFELVRRAGLTLAEVENRLAGVSAASIINDEENNEDGTT